MATKKTKRELEAENELLRAQIEVLNWRLQASEDDLNIEQHQVEVISGRGLKGTHGNQDTAGERLETLLDVYDTAREVGMSPDETMLKANGCLPDYGFESCATVPTSKQLKASPKKHRPADWP
jgi:hypothetical protein